MLDNQTLEWLIAEWQQRLREALVGITGNPVPIESRPLQQPPHAAVTRQWKLEQAAPGAAAAVVASSEDRSALGQFLLASAGIEDADESASQSTVDEVLDQAVSGFCQGLSARCGREILPVLQTDAASGEPVLLFALNAGDQAVQLWMLASQALLDALPAPSNTEAEPLPARPAANGAGTCPGNVDLLLDVELPVSVSFGRAQLPLKDVIKLTTGSIVELNRSVNEPVEVIVNNCVIARGEVVVVEGNFGVRIQKVISRQERLRTLH